MAELKKFEEYDVDRPLEEQQEIVEQVATQSKSRIKKITALERAIIAIAIVVFLGLSIGTVRLTITISKAEEEISTIQQGIAKKTDKINELEQEKNELSRVDRIREAANKAGLENNEDSIRKVTK